AQQGTSATPPVLSSIRVTPANSSIVTGAAEQFMAVGSYSDGSTQSLTSSVTWSSSNAAVAAINGGGLAIATGLGTATIQAALGGVNGSTTLTVTLTPGIAVSVLPPTARV